ncbi:hydrogenase nickel incorporation protein HypB [uncultured Coprobacter sp.]|jgi:hydrogenase accessory protein hypB|uniref:hydrogenase nickel incorporation protein HypB n=1 Tax=uncultured Coprobacter sp. TaxID=1720550 RepID=UPI0025D990E3|nr:hydrogenase nickel incorporation protein HypB [uncultured Coprobacter sp.]
MCETCGCDHLIDGITHEEMHALGIAHEHERHHSENRNSREHLVERNILSENNLIAARNRGYFEAKSIFVLNIVSSPGSGKTTLLEKTLFNLKTRLPVAVIEGDQQTDNDADRIRALDIPCIQINTRNGCHLDAAMIHHAMKKMNLQDNSLLFIENVGNLVCPALFDLGENKRVVLISVTEGDDKPLKYPYMFDSADICIINKIDLLPYVDSKIERIRDNALKINPNLIFFELSATVGTGIDQWCDFLCDQVKK